MVELEIQALAHERDGLLVEVGRLVALEGFTLARQRLVQDPHGTLLSMVVRGSWFHKRALRGALERCERLISFEIQPWKEGEERPHFAATRHLNSGYVPSPPAAPPAPAPALAATPVARRLSVGAVFTLVRLVVDAVGAWRLSWAREVGVATPRPVLR